MAEFVIKIADERGRTLQQFEHGYSEAEVRDRYTQQGFLVYSVKPRGLLAGGEVGLGRRRKIKPADFVIFNQQFLTLIHAGLPILNSLELLIKRQSNTYFRTVLENVRDRVKSGNMEEVLQRYISYQRVAQSFKKKLAVSLVYPALLIVTVIVLLSFLVTYVVPQFALLFSNLNAQLPTITLIMLSVGTFTRRYILVILVALAVLLFIIWRWKNTESGAAHIDRAVLSIPMVGTILLKQQVATFARTLSTLLQGGLPLVPAMETAGSSMSSRKVVNGISKATVHVREGKGLSKSLEDQKIFPPLAVEMIEVGESTGALPGMLTSVAEFYEEDVQTALGAAMALIEPVILIFMALVVGTVMVSLYLPLFSLGGGLH